MGRVGAGIGLGLVIGPILGSTMSHLHPNAPPLLAGLLAFLDLIAVYCFMPETRAARVEERGTPSASRRPLRQALFDAAIVSVMACYFLTFICMTNVQVSLALLADERLQWTATEVGHLFGLYGSMALLMQGAIGRLSQRVPGVTLLVAGTCAIGLGMATIGLAHAPWSLMLGVALAGLGAGLTNPTLASLASQHASVDEQGAILGFAQSAGGAARTVGPVWSGLLYARLGASAPFISGVLAAVLSLAVALALRRRLGRVPAGTPEAA
jgi:MFS family permease